MAHDLAATRRVRKGILSGGNGQDTLAVPPASAAPVAPHVAAEASPHTPPDAMPEPTPTTLAPLIGERVVADVRHEIGNYFHKLYYWADFLAESRSGRAPDVTATQMLEGTIRELEELLQATLEYVRPMAASPIRMQVREVIDGIVRQLGNGLAGRAVTPSIDDGLPADRAVLVDPGRLSQLLAALVRRIESTTEHGRELVVRVSAERRGAHEVVVVRASGVATGTTNSTLSEVEWATAENVARLAGGELSTHDAGGLATIALTLPLRS
jgi:signal transduction histidine kinase